MNNKQDKKFNPTVTAVFPNEKFGEGALLSAEIDAKAYDVLQQIEIGQKLLLKPSKKTTKSGETYYFMEVLPRFEKTRSRNDEI
jgi:hypothetical protein